MGNLRFYSPNLQSQAEQIEATDQTSHREPKNCCAQSKANRVKESHQSWGAESSTAVVPMAQQIYAINRSSYRNSNLAWLLYLIQNKSTQRSTQTIRNRIWQNWCTAFKKESQKLHQQSGAETTNAGAQKAKSSRQATEPAIASRKANIGREPHQPWRANSSNTGVPKVKQF